MNIYAFDVDETLDVSAGPVSLASIDELKRRGDIVGLNGNWCRYGIVSSASSARWKCRKKCF
jgi:hypothetical protein